MAEGGEDHGTPKPKPWGGAEAFWRNFDLRDGGPKAAGRLL